MNTTFKRVRIGGLRGPIGDVTVDLEELAEQVAEDAAATVEAAASVVGTAEKRGRPDAALVMQDNDARSVTLFTGRNELDAARFPAWIASLEDRILFDILSSPGTQWRGTWAADDVYSVGDVVQTGMRTFFFCIRDRTRWLVAPVEDQLTLATDPGVTPGWVEIPLLLTGEEYAFNDDFATNGPAQGRSAGGGLLWNLTGPGRVAGTPKTIDGYMTAEDNTYFCVEGIPGVMTEFGCEYRATSTPNIATLGIRKNPTPGGFPEIPTIFDGLWHSNWYYNGVGESTYWNEGDTYLDPANQGDYLYQHIAGLIMPAGKTYELVERVRGFWLIGYLDGELAWIELERRIGAFCGFGNADGIFVQNHTLADNGGGGDEFGGERQERVWVKIAA